MLPVPAGLPAQSLNQSDRTGAVSSESLARSISEFHQRGLAQRRYRDLTAEKYLIHVDGEGDGQWADIYMGDRIVIPRPMGGMRRQENILRPIVENMVAYHTTMPLRFVAETGSDPIAREHAKIDTALANYIVRQQRLNSVLAQAMWLAAVYGHCPVHAFWRDDVQYDAYEPAYGMTGYAPRRGMIDIFAGNPFDTVYDNSAKWGHVRSMSYGRLFPADVVRQSVQGVTVEGTDKVPSSSTFQRTIRKWAGILTDAHGSAAMGLDRGGEEMVTVVCREWAPGVDPQYPDGRLAMVALNGAASSEQKGGRPVLIHDGPLPGGRFSSERFYGSARYDDILGKPFVADIDDDQVHLNQLLSLRAEFIRRSVRAPLVTQGVLKQDTAAYDDDAQIEIDPSAKFMPAFLELPSAVVSAINQDITETRGAMFTKGGYQAASRGESQSGDAAAKVVALQRADDTIHGPVNQEFRQSAANLMQLCWSLFKEYGDVPWVIEAMGSDMEHISEAYIDRTKVSEEPPTYRVVSGMGSSPENRMEQLLGLVTMAGADGEPLLRTSEARKLWPDPSMFDDRHDVAGVKRRRAITIVATIRKMVMQYRQQTGFQETQFGAPWVQQAGIQIALQTLQSHPQLQDDDVQAHIDAYSEVIQDEREDAITRHALIIRQQKYYMRAAMMAAQQAQMAQPQQAPQKAPASGRRLPDQSPQAEVRQLTAEASGA